ncbi:putative eka-like protein [Erysiphe necator]|uniref:Putative eka-like protein n=1 Tax=Uncinula necator TaxID=52586 RepID=A0A0B1P9D9_UNCNE|nr:putative eka-like protein [Erysiphe necator]
MLANEIERVSSKRPAFVKLYGTLKPDALHRTWMAFFTDTPRVGFRVFDESRVTKVFKKKQPIEFCKRKADDREYQVTVRAIAVKAKAAIDKDSDRSIEILTNSQSSNTSATNNKTPNNTQSSNTSMADSNEALGETATSVEMRL